MPAAAPPPTAPGPRPATLAGITVLPGRNGRALLRINAVESATVTGVGSAGGRPAATAAATGAIADFKLLDNGPSAIGVRVISPPSLSVLAGTTKTVDYTAPVLEITIPGKAPIRVSSAGSHVDVVVPVDAASTEAATDLARTENLPLLGGLPLIDLLTGITSAVSGVVGGATAIVPGADLNSLLGALPGLPAVGGLLGSGGTPSSSSPSQESASAPARVVVLRVELGAVEKQFSSTGVYAKAASVRVKLISRNTWKSTGGYGHGGSGPADNTSLIDLGICTLETAAAAPKAPAAPGSTTAPDDDSDGGYGPDDDSDGGGYGHHGGGTGGTGGGTGGGGGLPVTGNNVALMLGGGVLLVVAGRLLQILARRRTA
ncbi:hypothetical protein OHA72_04515 [Dactylosporangium sp. NBC_01737]|uniref:hypothetical protein n=1 Tax=Dactylosporangium sp. NBC_01737 TaxID=2975959 RepID=UPI002E10F1A3|nr:hypothetical protein OHA72_04515 [Dactylosporangium sp. NBC_01737]